MVSTLQQASTRASADMLGFETFVNNSSGTQRPKFALRCLTFCRFLLTRAAPLTAFMAATIECSFTGPHTLRRLLVPLVAYCRRLSTAATTTDFNDEETWQTFIRVADLLT